MEVAGNNCIMGIDTVSTASVYDWLDTLSNAINVLFILLTSMQLASNNKLFFSYGYLQNILSSWYFLRPNCVKMSDIQLYVLVQCTVIGPTVGQYLGDVRLLRQRSRVRIRHLPQGS